MADYTAKALTTDKLLKVINQPLHGFIPGNVVTWNGTYVAAQADSAANCKGTMMVATVIDATRFTLCQEGFVQSITSQVFALNTQYYLDPVNAGLLTSFQPFTPGETLLPCFVSVTTSSGYFFGGSGNQIALSELIWNNVAINTQMVVNNAYFTDNGGTLLLQLPTDAVIGDRLQATALTGALQIDLAGNQLVTVGANTTIIGGNVLSTSAGASISLVCSSPDPDAQWHTDVGVQGSFTVT